MIITLDENNVIIGAGTSHDKKWEADQAANDANTFFIEDENSLPENFANLQNVKYINGEFDLSEAIDVSQNIQVSNNVPLSVTKRQGRQQMILLGLLDQVQAAIDSIPDPIQKALVQSFWDDSTQYERNHPQMIQLSAAVGMTEEQLDQAFIAASQL